MIGEGVRQRRQIYEQWTDAGEEGRKDGRKKGKRDNRKRRDKREGGVGGGTTGKTFSFGVFYILRHTHTPADTT